MALAELGKERTSTPDSLRRHYAKPPIQEVILQVDAELPRPSRRPALLRRLGTRLEKGFVPSRAIDEIETSDAGEPVRVVGQEYRSASHKELVRARSNGFSFHRLPPYTSWEEWTPRAFLALEAYRGLTRPSRLMWMSVRYVNRIHVPTPAELRDYFRTYPEIARGIPQSVAGYYLQTTIPHSSGTFILLRQGMIEPEAQDAAVIMLDIQLLGRLDPAVTTEGMKKVAERLHEIEIETFERCITNRTRELF